MPLTVPFLLSQATVVDTKTLQRDATGLLVLIQTLVIRNERTNKEQTTIRYFVPHVGEISAPAITAKGTVGTR